MNTLFLAAVLLATLGAPGRGGGGAPYQALDAGDVFVATITRVDDQDATNARPPRVWLEVHEMLRGDAKIVRSPAIWSPPFHGIDYGPGDSPELKAWEARPLKGPKVGQKLILGGKLWPPLPNQRAAPIYEIFGFVRIPYTDEARRQTIAHLALLDAEHRKYAAEQAAMLKEREVRAKAWRAAMDDTAIDKRTQEADAVAIATITGGDGWTVETMLKGQARMSIGGAYYVAIPSDAYDARIADIIWQRPRCILFLSEKKLLASVTNMHAGIIDPYQGVVLADDAAIAAVKQSLAKRPAPKPLPVLVISAFPRDAAAPLAEAARGKFAVIESGQFSGHGEHVVSHVRRTIPGAELIAMIDSDRRVQAVRITPGGSAPLYDAVWPAKDSREHIQALLAKLAQPAK